MPTKLWSCTPTKLTTWSQCPRRYLFTYLDRRAKGAPWAHNSVGLSAHNALRDWFVSLPSDRRTPSAAADFVTRNWIDRGFRDDAQSLQWRDRTADMTSSYAATLDPADEPIGVERQVSAPVGRLALSGRVDRIDLRPDGDAEQVVIVDYKTGRRSLTEDDVKSSLALAVYVVAARRTLRRPARRAELHHLPTGTVVAHDFSEEQLDRHVQRMNDIAVEAQGAEHAWRNGLGERAVAAGDGELEAIQEIDAVFSPRPSTSCSWCDVRQWCPEGRTASVTIEPWAALGD